MPGRSGYLSGFAAGLFCFLSIFCHSAVLYAERLQQIDQQPSYSPVAPQFQDLKTLPKIKVKTFEFTGNTIFSSEQLGKISAPYENREITFEELESLRQAITLHYVNNGYINSGAIIPDQQVVDGTVRIQVIEGNITSINVEGNKYFRTSYFTKRIERATGPPLNMGKLQDMLQLLNQDSRIKRLNAELKPGVKPGEGELNVKVEENLPYKASINFNNNVNPSIGDVKGELWLSHQNLFGLGDVLEGSYGKTQGLDEYRISYSLPITAYDTYLNVHYTNNQSTVIQDVFRSLDIKSLTNTFGITLSQPIIRTPEHEFWLSLTGDYRDSTQTLLGEGFSFSEGQDDGKSKVRVLRFAQEYVSRSQNQIIAARSSFSLGLSILGATRGDSPGPDGRFLAWLGQVKYLRKITEGGTQFVFRTDMQFTRDPLLPIEKFSIGGINSVRGYPENQLVRDNGIASSFELRIPIYTSSSGNNIIYLVPFTDFGWSWNSKRDTPDPDSIGSAGMGVMWNIANRMSLQFYYGYPFRNIDKVSNSLQEQGFNFQFVFGFL